MPAGCERERERDGGSHQALFLLGGVKGGRIKARFFFLVRGWDHVLQGTGQIWDPGWQVFFPVALSFVWIRARQWSHVVYWSLRQPLEGRHALYDRMGPLKRPLSTAPSAGGSFPGFLIRLPGPTHCFPTQEPFVSKCWAWNLGFSRCQLCAPPLRYGPFL